MIDELKKIWKACFDDEDSYIDFYFAQRYCPENTLVHYIGEKAVAMFTLLPVTVVANTAELKARYVYAVATLPEYQRKGISHQLTAEADKKMQAENCRLSVVVPATESLFTFYKKQGYTTAFYRRVVTFPTETIDITATMEGRPLYDVEKLYALREYYFNKGFFVRWDSVALQYAMAECRTSGGEVFYFTDEVNEGYIFVEIEGDTVLVKETALTPTMAPLVLPFLKKYYSECKQITFRVAMESFLWNDCGVVEPVAMLKWFGVPPDNLSIVNAYIGLLKD